MNLRNVVAELDWDTISRDLDEFGVARTGPLLNVDECRALRGLYDSDGAFRSRIVMQQHGFGAGEYKYFANPLPEPIAGLRRHFYERLVPLANNWNARMSIDRVFPPLMTSSWQSVMPTGRRGPRRCSSNTGRATTIACIRTSMESTSSRSNW